MTSTTQMTILKRCGPCPDFANLTLAFALQLRKSTFDFVSNNVSHQLLQILVSKDSMNLSSIRINVPWFQTSAAKQMRTALFLGYYATSSGNSSPTFRNNLSVPFSRVKKPRSERCSCGSRRELHQSDCPLTGNTLRSKLFRSTL